MGRYGDLGAFLEGEADFAIPSDGPYFPEDTERCVEVPWTFTRVRGARKVLDVGTCLADPDYFRGLLELVAHGVELWSVDIVPIAKVRNRFEGCDRDLMDRIRFEVGDVRRLAYESDTFDAVLCISVVEHVGFDEYIDAHDTVFNRPFEDYEAFPDYDEWGADREAIDEMVRVLRPGGRLILTAPFGSGGVFSSQDSKGRFAAHLEYNAGTWERLKASLDVGVASEECFFRRVPDVGWREVGADGFEGARAEGDYRADGVVCAVIVKP